MARSEKEMTAALENGIIKEGTDIHAVCADICTIVKGCVFEWCLSDGDMDIKNAVRRIEIFEGASVDTVSVHVI